MAQRGGVGGEGGGEAAEERVLRMREGSGARERGGRRARRDRKRIAGDGWLMKG